MKTAVGTNGAQTPMELQTKSFCTAPYIAVNANLRKFGGILRHGADVALTQGAHEYKAKRMGS